MGSEVIVLGAFLSKIAKTHQTKAKIKPIIKNAPTNVQKVVATACVHAPKDSGYHCAMEAFLVSTGIVALAEMGDKTQLATAVLAAEAARLIPVWLGSSLGMVVADGLAVVIGAVLGRRLPERAIKIGATVLFVLFGLLLLREGLAAR